MTGLGFSHLQKTVGSKLSLIGNLKVNWMHESLTPRNAIGVRLIAAEGLEI
jgi:hypothetical protein